MSRIPQVLTSRVVLSRFESLVPVSVHSKLGKVVKPKTFKNAGAGQPFSFEASGIRSAGSAPFSAETSLRK
ncbi:hypothetical protein ACHAWT_010494 [Skeletonema menzelii]